MLIVDDELDSLSLINEFVIKGGYDTFLANSGQEALEVVESLKPEIILLDAVMPEINGLDVLRKIKMSKETQRIPVIMISALGPGIKLMLSKETQADYYMSKPFSGKELLLAIDNLLNTSFDEECWVNYNDIRRVARVHKNGCIHCTPNSDNSKNVVWKKYPSQDNARAEFKRSYQGYSWSPCKICMNKK